MVSINSVSDEDDLMIINKSGLTIRMDVASLRVMGRATQGVRLINIKGNDSIAAVTKVMKDDEIIETDDAAEETEIETTAEDKALDAPSDASETPNENE